MTNPQKLALLKQVLQEGAHVAVHGKIISSWAAVHATMKEHESFSSPAGSAAIKVPVAETLRSEAERDIKEYTEKGGKKGQNHKYWSGFDDEEWGEYEQVLEDLKVGKDEDEIKVSL